MGREATRWRSMPDRWRTLRTAASMPSVTLGCVVGDFWAAIIDLVLSLTVVSTITASVFVPPTSTPMRYGKASGMFVVMAIVNIQGLTQPGGFATNPSYWSAHSYLLHALCYPTDVELRDCPAELRSLVQCHSEFGLADSYCLQSSSVTRAYLQTRLYVRIRHGLGKLETLYLS